MPLERDDLKYLWDMLRAGERALEYVAGSTRAQYMRDAKTQAAVERAIEILGEAAKRVTDHGRTQFPHVEWGAIVATRHILAHEYGDIDHEKIWRMVTIHIPELLAHLRPALAANPPGPQSKENLAEP